MKLDIADKHEKGRVVHLEISEEKARMLYGKKIGDEVEGSLIDPRLSGFKLKITGLTNIAGFPAREDVEGVALKKVLLTKGTGMRGKRSGKKKKIKGLRLRKTIRGNTIAKDISQVNMKVIVANKSIVEVIGKKEKEQVKAETGTGAESEQEKSGTEAEQRKAEQEQSGEGKTEIGAKSETGSEASQEKAKNEEGQVKSEEEKDKE